MKITALITALAFVLTPITGRAQSTFGGSFPTTGTPIGAKDQNGKMQPLRTAPSGAVLVAPGSGSVFDASVTGTVAISSMPPVTIDPPLVTTVAPSPDAIFVVSTIGGGGGGGGGAVTQGTTPWIGAPNSETTTYAGACASAALVVPVRGNSERLDVMWSRVDDVGRYVVEPSFDGGLTFSNQYLPTMRYYGSAANGLPMYSTWNYRQDMEIPGTGFYVWLRGYATHVRIRETNGFCGGSVIFHATLGGPPPALVTSVGALWDPTSQTMQPMQAAPDNTDSVGVAVAGLLTIGRQQVWNGSTFRWDRLYGDTTYGARSNLMGVGGQTLTLGQKPQASSVPVVLPSDQTVAVTITDPIVVVSTVGATASNGLTDAQLRATPVPVSGTVTATVASTSANQGTGAAANAPWSMRLSDGAAFYNAPTSSQLPASLGAQSTAASLSVVPATSSSFTVAQGTASNLKSEVVGTKTNNSAAPAATNVGALTGVATAAAPTYVEGNLVALSTDLSGGLRVGSHAVTGSGNFTVVQGTGTNLHTVIDSGTVTATVTSTSANQGTAAAANAPWSMRLSDGAAFYKTNTDAQLPASLGPQSTAASLSVVPATSSSFTVAQSTRGNLLGNMTLQIGGVDNAVGNPAFVSPGTGATWAVTNAGLTNLDVTLSSRWGTLGQKAMAGSAPVVIASDQSAIHTIVDSGTVTATVSGTVTANQGGAPWSVTGNKSNNGGAPAATNLGVLPVVATAAAPTYTEGNQAALSTDLAGSLRITGSISASNPSVGTNGAATPGSGTAVAWDDAGTLRTASAAKPLPVSASVTPPASVISAANSSTTPLAGNATFTGTGTSILNYAAVIVAVFSNVSSATSGVQIQFSQDNANWNDALVTSYTAGGAAPNDGQVYGANARGQYARVVYTNGAGAQATFRLQTILSATNTTGDTIDVNEVLSLYNHATVTKSVIAGKTTAGGGSYVDVKVNPSGALVVVPGSEGATAAAVPGSASYVGVNVGGNLTGVTGTGTSMNVNVTNATVPVAGATTPSDGFTNPTTAIPAFSFLAGWNGATWDRVAIEGTAADGDATMATGALATEAYPRVFNGATFDRVRGNATGGMWVQGPAASGAATAGNPVLIGGPVAGGAGNMANATVKAASTQPALTDTALVVADRSTGATGSAVPATGALVGGGAAGGAGNLTAATVKAASTLSAATDTSLVVQPNVGFPTLVGYTTGAGTTASIATVKAASVQPATTDTALVVAPRSDGATGSAVPATAGFIAGGAAAGAGNLTGATVKAGSTIAASSDTALVVASIATPVTSTVGLSQKGITTITAGQNIKASAGCLYGFGIVNGAGTGCWLQCMDAATGGTLGTNTIWQAPIVASATVYQAPGAIPLACGANGIACGMASAVNGASNCGTAATAAVFYFK
jgi:hypothetical protein